MRVLVACEESQVVCTAMRKRGHEAYSCDLMECSGGHPEWHIQEDVLSLINGDCDFQTRNGDFHFVEGTWDLLIAHPPCTFLTSAGAVRLFNRDHSIKDPEREKKGWEAKDFFLSFYNANCPRICIENPTPMKHFGLPLYSQIVEPYMFGEPWKKRTCLWLKGLPLLTATEIVEPLGLWVGSTSKREGSTSRVLSKYNLRSNRSSKERSKTFPGIAEAMAEQWTDQGR